MAVEKLSISMLMKLTGLLALNLAVLRVIPVGLLGVPLFVYLFVVLDVALAHLLVFHRPLGVRHTVFLVLGILFSIAHVVYVNYLIRVGPAPDPSWSRILETAVHAYVSFTGDSRSLAWTRTEEFSIAEGFLASLIGLGLAWSLGLGFEWWLHVLRVDFNGRRWRGVVGASRGALFGLILAGVVLTGAEFAFSSMRVPSPGGTLMRLAVTLAFLLIGGELGWVIGRRTRDNAPGPG